MEENDNTKWILYIWDIYTNAKKSSQFYKEFAGYDQRSYIDTVSEEEAVLFRLRGYSMDKSKDSYGCTPDGRIYKVYHYDGVLEKIPTDARIRLNDSAYMVFQEYAHKLLGLFDKYSEIFKSLYEIEIEEYETLTGIKPEGGEFKDVFSGENDQGS